MNCLSVEVVLKQEFQDDETYFLQILPQMVWKNLLGKIDDPVDFESVVNASEYFRKQLLPERTTILFPKVFLSLASRYDRDCSEAYEDVSSHSSVPVADQDRVWKYPGGYRLVCRDWNQAVDNYYQQHPSHFRIETDATDEEWPGLRRCIGYYTPEDISPNLLHFFYESHTSEQGTAKRNPLFQRALNVFVNSSDIGGAANAVGENILQIFGREVWYLYMDITNTHGTLTEFYFALKDLLEMVPNLRVLRLIYNKGQWQSWRAKSRLRKAVKLNPLKRFPKLQFLEVAQNLPPPILNELLGKNTQVYKLDILAAGHNIFRLHLPNLRELSIRIRSWLEFNLLRICGNRWKLEVFRGLFTNWGSDETLGKIFQMLEANWMESLHNVNILRSSMFTDEKLIIQTTSRSKLSLPLLRTFRLTINHYIGLDFLLPSAKNLESIIIEQLPGFRKLNKRTLRSSIRLQKIQFLGFEDKLGKSNIWIKLPNLKKIVCGPKTFYRKRFYECSILSGTT